MATNEKVLEELYELLGLYFGLEIGAGVIRPGGSNIVEPQLDRVIFREQVLTRITTLIIEGFVCNSKGEE